MKLDQVQIQDFRNLESVVIHPSPELNVIVGQNGSGKSSLLEAIHYLGYGRSFRTSKHKSVVKHEKSKFSVFTRGTESNAETTLGLSRAVDGDVVVSVNGHHSNRVSELVAFLPIQIFTPQSSDLIVGGPSLRRKFLDWGLFHVEHSFASLANRYAKCLSQKNSLLKQNSFNRVQDYDKQEEFWDVQISTYGELLDTSRKSIVARLEAQIYANLEQFLPEFCFEISYHSGWDTSVVLLEAIRSKADKDARNGFLSIGPHKADLVIQIQNKSAAEVLSRGQQRMLVAALQLAQTQLLNEAITKKSVFLLDDVGAELDASKRKVFIDQLLKCDAQLFVTAIEKSQLGFLEHYKNYKMFHVEHGQVIEEN